MIVDGSKHADGKARIGATSGSDAATESVMYRKVAEGLGLHLFNHSPLYNVKQMPLPGVVIFVHGVNSDGEWFAAAEEGLCKGLNRRLGRLDTQLAFTGVQAGQMSPVSYREGLTEDGYINPQLTPDSYVKSDPSFSPVIHFRWGYKASKEALKEFGANTYLNEQNYWGGGPFANGCTSLPDLWNVGLDDRIFGWIMVQALNSTDRLIYRTPARHYMVVAALRLAKLISAIRAKQADVAITVVCHSQGNMVGLAAAFLGDCMPEVTDPLGKAGRCVADTYVLASPPYSLVSQLGTESWAQRKMKDANGNRGRETLSARVETLRNFFDILRKRAALEPDAFKVDEEMANENVPLAGGKAFSAAMDRKSHGLNGHTYGRATLYCCPHDQVISATTVQGMGWRGLNANEFMVTNGEGVFTQRVFASGYPIGQAPGARYRYWEDDWRASVNEHEGFFFPPSPPAKFGFSRQMRANPSELAAVGTLAIAPLLHVGTLLYKVSINADPPKNWAIPVNAPALDEPFLPIALRYGVPIVNTAYGKDENGNPIALRSDFNEPYDPPAASRNVNKIVYEKNAGDPYDAFASPSSSQEASGTQASEAAQRYRDHAHLRQEARRDENEANRGGRTTGWIDEDGKVTGEDDLSSASADYSNWREKRINAILAGAEVNPTNHSTLMVNPMHAEKALAYDIAIGVCNLSSKDMHDFRIEADWRMGESMEDSNPNKKYFNYFYAGNIKEITDKRDSESDIPLQDWLVKEREAALPTGIADERQGGLFLATVGALL
jgi:pimeloyl-ACP methyl ester carboxylesterase